MTDAAKWYVVHTYSSYENTVKATIEKTVENRHMEDMIHQVAIPMETVTEMGENGVQKTYERKVFPGYVLVKAIMSDQVWYAITNVRGVTGFVGSGTKPTPLTEDEVLKMGVEKREIVLGYEVGDRVSIIDGPMQGVVGVVDVLEPEKNYIRVLVPMFGRENPVDLELDQVERASE